MRLTVAGLTERVTELKAMAARVADLTPAMQVAAEAMTKGISDRFRSATDWDGAPWKPLAPSTVARRRKGSNRILQDMGILKNSISVTAAKRSITFGTNVEYAGIHQFGGTAGRKSHPVTIPRRSFLPVTADGKSIAQGGPAQALVARIARYIRTYVLTGKVG